MGSNRVSVLSKLVAHLLQCICLGELHSKTVEHYEESDKVHRLAEKRYFV
jgi:hypothetical protein